MKKLISVLLISLALVATVSAAEKKGEGVMTYEEYVAAPLDSKVVVETYVQAKQAWKSDSNKATFYTQDKDGGAYFIYEMPCSQDEYKKLVPGTKIKVTGYKSAWAGEVEIMQANYEILKGKYVAKALDVTKLLGTDDIEKHQNALVSFKGMKVEPMSDGESSWYYRWNGAGTEGDDLYFSASKDGKTYTFVIESDLCDSNSAVYKKVKSLKVGDVLNIEGFLYWYNGIQPHITSIK